uniref:Uncharacterized protein n=1 Tax=Glossina pallidipes TaxID=7398 RepID=A0A1A9ZG39_GLOPL
MPNASDDVVLGLTFLKAFKAVITVAGLSTTCEMLDNPFEHWSVANRLTSQERLSDDSDAQTHNRDNRIAYNLEVTMNDPRKFDEAKAEFRQSLSSLENKKNRAILISLHGPKKN